MEESCLSCGSWAEEIYWNHFQFIHFSQFLRTGYDQHLAIPKRFSDSIRKKLPDSVVLRGPSGAVWGVGLTAKDDMFFFTWGWKQFVKDHHLQENDLLVFKYNGELQFDILIFDGESLCEKEASYFVRKCGHVEDERRILNKTKRKEGKSFLEEAHTPSDAGAGCTSPEKSINGNCFEIPSVAPTQATNGRVQTFSVKHVQPKRVAKRKEVHVENESRTLTKTKRKERENSLEEAHAPSDAGAGFASPEKSINGDCFEVPSVAPTQATNERVQTFLVKHVRPKRATKRKEVPDYVQVDNSEPDVELEPASISKSGTYGQAYISNRRPVTEAEKQKAIQLAEAAMTPDSFTIVMRPTHVYKRYYVLLPAWWAQKHLSQQNQDMILRVGDNTWCTRYNFNRPRHCAGLTGGWKHFAVDNNLEEFDVCVFEPAGKINDCFAVNIKIFRVLEEVTPLVQVNSGKQVAPKKHRIEDELRSKAKAELRMWLARDEQRVAQSFTSSFPSFVKIMKMFNVSGSFTLKIPLQFSAAHLPNCKTGVVLQNLQGKQWVVNSVPATKGRTVHTFCGGWKAFVRDNNINFGDTCIFELVAKFEMRVHISGVGKQGFDTGREDMVKATAAVPLASIPPPL